MRNRKKIGLFLGPVLFLLFLILPQPEQMPLAAWRVAAVTALMATWWISEAIPIPATALLPIALFPMLGVMPSAQVTPSYANHLIYLYLGGFLIAVTIERWGLHRRLALMTIALVGVSPNRIVLGFMIATAALSMWISNTATTMMMLPIGVAVIGQALTMAGLEAEYTDREHEFRFGTSLMLGIAYGASIGGVATLIGTPPNAILAGVIEKTYGQPVSFLTWMKVGLPISIIMLILTWLYLTRFACRSEIEKLPGGRKLIREELHKLGPVSTEQKWVLAVFLLVAGAWIFRGMVPWEALSMVGDATIAIVGATALFLIPSDWKRGVFLLDWKTAVKLPWDIIILFGGGFALADGFSRSGLSEWIAGALGGLSWVNPIVLIAVVALTVILMTEIASNTATASVTLPVVGAFAEAVHMHPYGLMVTVAVGASFAFMMPVSTPPNAIVFSSRRVTIPQMVRVGSILILIGTAVLVLAVVFWLPTAWGIDLFKFSASPVPLG